VNVKIDLTFTHVFLAPPASTYGRIARPLMTSPSSSLTVRKILPCSVEEAFQAWTKPELFKQWFAPDPTMQTVADIDLRLGGKYQIGFKPAGGAPTLVVGGEFLTIEAPRRLEYTWIWEKASHPDWKDRTIVKVEFNSVGPERTEIVLTHERFSDSNARESHHQGWTAIIDRMAAAVGKRPQ
jgi:uncharacterized protein YndB with AHSA1/START domain